MTERSIQEQLKQRWGPLGAGAVLALGSLWLGVETGQRASGWQAPGRQAPDPEPIAEDTGAAVRTGPPVASPDDYLRAGIPDLSDVSVVQQRKDQFFGFLKPLVEWENRRLEIIRGQVREWRLALNTGEGLSQQSTSRLMALADQYYADTEQPTQALLDELWRKIDILPPSMVVAQAANESAWGTSRFAREGNNLFGQWCFSAGCGIVPKGRPEGKIYEVRDYDSPALSVRSFMLNLNRHQSYSELREARAELRAAGKTITGLQLIPYLEAYSTRREAYVEEIRNMITFNNLQGLDR